MPHRQPRVSRAALAIVALLALTSPLGAAEEHPATVTLRDAVELVDQARRTDSLDERWTLYETALSYLNQIIRVFYRTEIGDRLWHDQTTGGISVFDVVRPLWETGIAVCEKTFSAGCVLRLALDALQISRPIHSAQFLTQLIEAQAAVGDIAAALATAEQVVLASYPRDVKPILVAMVKAGQSARAIDMARGFDRGRARDSALFSISRAIVETGETELARETAAAIEGPGRRASALAAVAAIGSFDPNPGERAALFEEAIAIADNFERVTDCFFEHCRPASILFDVARRQFEAGERDDAQRTFAKALADSRAIPKWWIRSSILTTVFYTYSDAARRALAPGLVEEFMAIATAEDNISGRVTLQTRAAFAAHRLGEPARARSILERARAIALEAKPSDVDGVFRTLLRKHLRIGDIQGGLATIEVIPAGIHSAYHEGNILELLAKAGDFERIRRVQEPLVDYRKWRNIRYHIAPSLTDIGALAEVRDLAGEIEWVWEREDIWAAVAKAQAAAGAVDDAVATARSLSDPLRRAATLRGIAAAEFEAGHKESAEGLLLDGFRAAVSDIDGTTVLASRFHARAEELKEIGKLLAGMKPRG